MINRKENRPSFEAQGKPVEPVAQKSYPDTTTVNYTYDNDSRLTQMTDPTGTYQFTFDNTGRLGSSFRVTTPSYHFHPPISPFE
jgi:YD repeat-containing protein